MANKRISELPAAGAITGAELVEIVQSGVNVKTTVSSVGSGATPNLNSVLSAGNNAGANKIINLSDPTDAQDAATKAYVDGGDFLQNGAVNTLIGNTAIDGDLGAYEFNFSEIANMEIGINTGSFEVGTSDGDSLTIGGGTASITSGDVSVGGTNSAQLTGPNTSLILAAQVEFTDSRGTPVGIEYDADYSANFTSRSLIDKGYVVGTQDLYIPASAMWPRVTNGCAPLTQTEIATSLLNIQTLDFDQTTQEFAQFTISIPRNWNNGTITAKVYWTASAGSGGVVWGISGVAYSNDDPLTGTFGTAQTVADTLTATNDLDTTDPTSAITIAGTPADADLIALQISRNPADGSDTLNADAKLIGIVITITTDAAKAA